MGLLPTSGPLAFSKIRLEVGGPVRNMRLSYYYSDATPKLYTDGIGTTPSIGSKIALSDMRGKGHTHPAPDIWLSGRYLTGASGSNVTTWRNAGFMENAYGVSKSGTRNPTMTSSTGTETFVTCAANNDEYVDLPPMTYKMSTIGGFAFIAALRVRSSSAYQRIFSCASAGGIDSIELTQSSDLRFRTNYYTSIDNYHNATTGTITANTWVVVGFRLLKTPTNGNDLWLNNGTKIPYTDTTMNGRDFSTTYNRLARSPTEADPVGKIDVREVMVFNRVLTDAEMSSAMSSVISRNPVG